MYLLFFVGLTPPVANTTLQNKSPVRVKPGQKYSNQQIPVTTSNPGRNHSSTPAKLDRVC